MRDQLSECEARPFLREVEARQCLKQKDIGNHIPTCKSQSQYGVVPLVRVTLDIMGTSQSTADASVPGLTSTLPGGCSR
jgi:hypothetical protein